jgi:diacylglycerol diphosphate phosphatase/phosphatidate phosphatase
VGTKYAVRKWLTSSAHLQPWPQISRSMLPFEDHVIYVGLQRLSALTTYSYALDWVIYGLVNVFALSYEAKLDPRFHEFLLHDPSIMHSFIADVAVNVTSLILIAVGIPLVVMFIVSAFDVRLSSQRKVWDIFIGYLTLCGAMATQMTIVNILKNTCGLPRPDLLARCFPLGVTSEVEALVGRGTLASIALCESPHRDTLVDGFRSFPSGHLSTVFCGMVITSLQLCGKLQVCDGRGCSVKLVASMLPLVLALYVASTRVSDNRHFVRDIFSGSTIGSLVAMAFHHQYFPNVFDLQNGGRALLPRRHGVARFFNHVGGVWRLQEQWAMQCERQLNSLNACLPNVALEPNMDLEASIALVNKERVRSI